ncbi:MAG: TrbC/VirB2 family protein [Terriglobia bacterium]
MSTSMKLRSFRRLSRKNCRCNWWPILPILALPLIFPLAAYAQVGGSPFDTGFTALQTLFTGTVAKVASLIAIVIGGYGFAHGEPGAKKVLAGVAAGTGIAVLAVNVLSWLWGV